MTIRGQSVLSGAAARQREAIRGAVERGALEVARIARQDEAPKAFSTLTQSITHRMEDDLTARVISGQRYSAAVEYGSAPGGYPPRRAISEWARIQGLSPRAGQEWDTMVYFIRRAIYRDGIPENPFMRRSLDAAKPTLERLATQAGAVLSRG